MSISEADISILIPTFRYRDKIVRALESALESGASEIIVVDDCSRDGTIEALACYKDPRLTVIENERNLGLWENHLKALGLATRPWIKFIQADDYLLSGGLAAYAAAAAPEVSVISGAPVLKDDETDETWITYKTSQPLQLDWCAFERACHLFGWFLGSPSYMMLRADAITRDPQVWRREMSADLVVGTIAAGKGAVVVLPPGAIGQGVHASQNSYTQGAGLALIRSANSLAYLRATGDSRLQRLADAWTMLNLARTIHCFARGALRREGSIAALLSSVWLYLSNPGSGGWIRMLSDGRSPVLEALWYRKIHRPPFDLDVLFRMPDVKVPQ